jgi:hypothetical protein
MAPFSQVKEPPQNPGRFIGDDHDDFQVFLGRQLFKPIPAQGWPDVVNRFTGADQGLAVIAPEGPLFRFLRVARIRTFGVQNEHRLDLLQLADQLGADGFSARVKVAVLQNDAGEGAVGQLEAVEAVIETIIDLDVRSDGSGGLATESDLPRSLGLVGLSFFPLGRLRLNVFSAGLNVAVFFDSGVDDRTSGRNIGVGLGAGAAERRSAAVGEWSPLYRHWATRRALA